MRNRKLALCAEPKDGLDLRRAIGSIDGKDGGHDAISRFDA